MKIEDKKQEGYRLYIVAPPQNGEKYGKIVDTKKVTAMQTVEPRELSSKQLKINHCIF